jgi:spoIIIJ-associated protein
MNEPKRRFFSGDSLQQALVQAANHYNIDPEEIAYRSLEKKHGFIKVRRKVVIEVNPDAPRREPREKGAPPPPSPAAASAPVESRRGETEPPRERRTEEPPARAERPAPGEGGERRERAPRGDRRERTGRGDRGDRSHRGPRSDSAIDRGARSAPPAGASWTGIEEPRRREMGILEAGGLVALPDTPRRVSERFPAAEGPQAEAAAKASELVLRIAGIDLTPRVLQGEDRLEVDLAGPDVDWCFADDGELVLAIEHLLPRMIRTLSGEPALVRVDCDNFQEIREERLRSLAQRMAEEVRRFGKPRTLEPMNPADRRIIHVTLADDPHVVTESEGDGYFKRVMIRPV